MMLRSVPFRGRRFLPASMLALAGAGAVMAGPWAVMDLAVTNTAQIVFPSETGKVYQLLASPDLKNWPAAGEPIFGTGENIELWPPTQADAGGHQFFRIRSELEPAGGLAPWKLTGVSLLLNEGERTVKYEFGANGTGAWKAGEVTRPFAWSWLRTGLNAGKITVTWPNEAREDLKLDFTATLLGRFVRDHWAEGMLTSTDNGTFGSVPVESTPLVPTGLAGRRIVMADGAAGSTLALETGNSGSRILEGQSQPVTYSWLVTGGNIVTLTANISATHGEEYRLIFTEPRTGKFVRKTFTEGVFRDEDAGVFTLSEAGP